MTCTANPKAAVAGIATFAGCKIDKSGTGYTLTATATGLTTTVSNTFTIVAGPATKVVYTQQPTAVVAGSAISPAVVVTVQDAERQHRHDQQRARSASRSPRTPAVEHSREPCRTTATNGVATFADLSINKTGTGYKLTITSTGLDQRRQQHVQRDGRYRRRSSPSPRNPAAAPEASPGPPNPRSRSKTHWETRSPRAPPA